MSELYDTDIVQWSEQQAQRIRCHAAGERLNEPPDWTNIIEEVESVGRGQVDAVESLWTLAFLHELKAFGWPAARDVEHWLAEARLFRRQAKRKFTPSMRPKIGVPAVYADALAGVPKTLDGVPPRNLPTACPVTLDQLLRD